MEDVNISVIPPHRVLYFVLVVMVTTSVLIGGLVKVSTCVTLLSGSMYSTADGHVTSTNSHVISSLPVYVQILMSVRTHSGVVSCVTTQREGSTAHVQMVTSTTQPKAAKLQVRKG